jgi:glycine cleavage system H protein
VEVNIMVVALVILTFLVFVVATYILGEHRKKLLLQEGEALHRAIEEAEPEWAAGFKLPSALSYHRGHTWVHRVGDDQAYVGLDDFARRLLGEEAKLTPPPVGTRVVQGRGALRVERNGEEVRLLSPLSGEVVGVNPRLTHEPGAVYADSYGRGWVLKIKSRRLTHDLRNLFSGSLARRWMEDTRDRFQHQIVHATGSVIQDGGDPVEDIASALGLQEWCGLVEEFLTLNEGERR